MIVKIITFALMAVFYACYFVKMISQRKQGISTDQLGKGKTGFVKFIEVTLKISTYVLPIIQLISIVWYAGTAHIFLRVIGLAITAVGVCVFITSVVQIVNVEEDFLIEAFGNEYLQYKAKVCRYLGRKL